MIGGIMGFTTIATAAAAAVPHVLQSVSSYNQSKALRRTADAQQQLAAGQANAMADTDSANQQRAARNAHTRLAAARADAAAGNLAAEGSVTVRERDLATRLQDEITANANAELERANTIRQQGALNAHTARQAARQQKAQAYGSAISAFGSLFGNALKRGH